MKAKYKTAALIGCLWAVACLSGCRAAKEYVTVIQANDAYQEGAYQKANFLYLQLLPNAHYPDFIAYNLGNVYYDLGVHEAALEQWESVSHSASAPLRFKMFFNRGVLYYGRGEYQKAFDQFRSAILLNPAHLHGDDVRAAKKNLEICLQKLNTESVGEAPKGAAVADGNASRRRQVPDSETKAMMNWVKNRERLNRAMAIEALVPVSEDY